jgi:hypothetical protein
MEGTKKREKENSQALSLDRKTDTLGKELRSKNNQPHKN